MVGIAKLAALCGVALTLAACQGSSIECASMGAVGGALAADVLGTDVAGGALIGGIAGATGNQTGLCTTP